LRRLHAEIASSAFLDYLLLYWAQMMQVEEIARDIGYLNSMTYQTAAMMTENAKSAANVGQNGNRKTTERPAL